jgi:hypothetical protein
MSVPALNAPSSQATPAAQASSPENSDRPGAVADPGLRSGVDSDSSAASVEPETPARDYFREAFMRVRGQTVTAPQAPPATARPARDTDQPEGSSDVRVQPSAEGERQTPGAPRSPGTNGASSTVLPERAGAPPANTPRQIVMTEDEFSRRVQAESDRKLARQRREEQDRRAREEEVELRRTNPWEYARLVEEKESALAEAQNKAKELNGMIETNILDYDRNVLDPIMLRLPEPVRAQVISGVQEHGIPGRAKIAQGALAALEKHWKDEGAKTARSRLANDPAFVKEILARHGGQRVEPDSSPSLPASAGRGPVSGNDAVNNFMRAGANAARQISGRGQ